MKTIRMNDEIKRVKDGDAKQILPTGWKYVSKKEWKKNRGKVKKEVVEVEEVVEEVIEEPKKESKYKQKKGRNAD